MKKSSTLLVASAILQVHAFSQTAAFELTFTGQLQTLLSASNIPLDSIVVRNLDQDCDTVLYWPDTVLSLGSSGLTDHSRQLAGFTIGPAQPNPFNIATEIIMSLPQSDMVELSFGDISGLFTGSFSKRFDAGCHSLLFIPGKEGFYLLTARYQGRLFQLKLISIQGSNLPQCELEYQGPSSKPVVKSSIISPGFLFSPGDSLRITGYYNGANNWLEDAPAASNSYILVFAMGNPCPETPSFTYGGQMYNTVQIGNQCWMKENLNIGTMLTDDHQSGPHTHASNNGIIEKYCYNNDTAQCTIYGGLYEWNEMMDYYFQQGVQGICPSGWHIPSNDEWCWLGIFLDKTVVCAGYHVFTGTDAGGKMKETGVEHWNSPNIGATNESGFTGRGGGYRFSYGSSVLLGEDGRWWSSSDYQFAYAVMFLLGHDYIKFYRDWIPKEDGHSVRCVKND